MTSPSEVDPDHRSGFVALVGRPNVGKSTLLNALLGQLVHAVSPKPQTTQVRQLGILTLEHAQIVFVDTPGMHEPVHRLGERMDEIARQALADAELVLVLFDLSEPPTAEDETVSRRVRALQDDTPYVVALTKLDQVDQDELAQRQACFQELLPGAVAMLPVSATRGDNLEHLLNAITSSLPSGPRYYPEETITDRYEREIAADLIRAAAMEALHDELPHSIAVRVDEYKERPSDGGYIKATVFAERDSQKGIIIGKNGAMIKRIGTAARESIEAMSGRSIYLDLRVKVEPGWRNDDRALQRLGFLNPRS